MDKGAVAFLAQMTGVLFRLARRLWGSSASPEGSRLVSVSPDSFGVGTVSPEGSGLVFDSPDAYGVGSVSPEG